MTLSFDPSAFQVQGLQACTTTRTLELSFKEAIPKFTPIRLLTGRGV